MSYSANDDTRAALAVCKLTKHNFAKWHKLLRLALRGRDLLDTLDPDSVPVAGAAGVTAETLWDWRKRTDRTIEMLETARRECQSTSHANTARYLRDLFEVGARHKGDMRTRQVQDCPPACRPSRVLSRPVHGHGRPRRERDVR